LLKDSDEECQKACKDWGYGGVSGGREMQLRRQLPLSSADQLPLSPPLTPARCCILLTLTPLLPCLAPPRPIVHVYYQAGKKDYPGGYVYYPFEPTKSDPERLVP
jgi:hypothetical protein